MTLHVAAPIFVSYCNIASFLPQEFTLLLTFLNQTLLLLLLSGIE